MANLVQNLRIQADHNMFLLIMTQIKNMAEGSKDAASFLANYGEKGTLASPDEWQRSHLLGFPTTSICIERIHREVKRVRATEDRQREIGC